MDDEESPNALQNVDDSFNSSDREANCKYHTSFKNVKTLESNSSKEDSIENRAFSEKEIVEFQELVAETLVQEKLKGTDVCSRSTDSQKTGLKSSDYDFTINEDENFQYDSLKNDDQKIPLDIKCVLDSEDSSECSANIVSKPSDHHKSISVETKDQPSLEESQSGFYNLEIINRESDSDEDINWESKDDLHHSADNEPIVSSNKEDADNSLILFHPGSLRSGRENESSETVVESRISSNTIDESQNSLETSKETEEKDVSSKSDVNFLTTSSTINKFSSYIVSSKRKERNITKKSRSPNLDKATLKLHKQTPEMNSIGTQTTYREFFSPERKHSLATGNQRISSSLKCKDHLNYNPLPNKASGPWSPAADGDNSRKFYPNKSTIKSLQQNLYNLTKADQILRKIHPFDYRPTLVHQSNPSAKSLETPRQTQISKPSKSIFFRTSKNNFVSTPSTKHIKPSINYNRPNSSFVSRNYDIKEKLTTNQTKGRQIPKDFSRLNRAAKSEYQTYNDISSRKSSTNGVDDPPCFRPAASLPDLRTMHEELIRSTSRLLRHEHRCKAYSCSPACAPHQEEEKYSYSVRQSPTVRRKSLENGFLLQGYSSGSTDSLIEEADTVTSNYKYVKTLCNAKRDELPLPYTKGSLPRFRRRRTKSSSSYLTPPLPPPPPALPPPPAFSPPLSPPPNPPSTSQRGASYLTGLLRTRSETDLNLTGGYHGEAPYLPYRKEQLSTGQIVKVLLPGEGVAMARVLFNSPATAARPRRPSTNNDVTLLLISEPTKFSGNVITLPLNKILLAWPKV